MSSSRHSSLGGKARRQALLLAALACMVVCPGVRGRVIHVPGNFTQIGTALFWAAPSDTILVGPGVYRENLVWPPTQGLKLLSADGPVLTIIEGGGQDQVIGIYSAVDTTTIVRGFTLRNGHASGT